MQVHDELSFLILAPLFKQHQLSRATRWRPAIGLATVARPSPSQTPATPSCRSSFLAIRYVLVQASRWQKICNQNHKTHSKSPTATSGADQRHCQLGHCSWYQHRSGWYLGGGGLGQWGLEQYSEIDARQPREITVPTPLKTQPAKAGRVFSWGKQRIESITMTQALASPVIKRKTIYHHS